MGHPVKMNYCAVPMGSSGLLFCLQIFSKLEITIWDLKFEASSYGKDSNRGGE